MNPNTIVLLSLLIKQALFMLVAVTVWLATKTFEYWLFSVENWSNIVSWWWFAAVPVVTILYVTVTFVTQDVKFVRHKQPTTESDHDDLH